MQKDQGKREKEEPFSPADPSRQATRACPRFVWKKELKNRRWTVIPWGYLGQPVWWL